MEAIRTYIENVFKAFPQNERVAVLKRDMLLGMEEKYNALKSEGKSENEAVGSVIADFGNIDEIAAELGVNSGISGFSGTLVNAGNSATETTEKAVPVTRDEAFDFINQSKKSGKWIGIGVWIIMAGVAALILIGNINIIILRGGFKINLPGYSDFDIWGAIGVFALFVAIAAAIPIFITHGFAISKFYEKLESGKPVLTPATKEDITLERERFMPKFTGLIAGGVALILLAVGGFILLSSFGFETERFETVPLALLLFIIGLGTYIFIVAGTEYDAYEVLLGESYYGVSVKNRKQSERIIGTVASVFWPLVTAAYLIWSFALDAWHISWLIWPIAGIVFGAFAGGISTWSENRK